VTANTHIFLAYGSVGKENEGDVLPREDEEQEWEGLFPLNYRREKIIKTEVSFP
jgi:hypothetical protein